MGYIKTEELREVELTHLMYEVYEDMGKEGYIVCAKHAAHLASCLDIDEDSFCGEDVIDDTLLDKWTDAVIYMIIKNQKDDFKKLIEKSLTDIECYEIIANLKELNLL